MQHAEILFTLFGIVTLASPLLAAEADSGVAATESGINVITLLMRGGWFMIPLLALSVLVVTIGVERFLALRRTRMIPRTLVDQLELAAAHPRGFNANRLTQLTQYDGSSAASVLRSMVKKTGRPLPEMQIAITESAQREATRLTRTTSWLTLAAAVAPLLGLLGTVWGITQAFYDTTQLVVGQNRAEALAEGIYTALVTTMAGLLIAIPAAILSHFYENRIVQLMNEIEELAMGLLPHFEKYEGKVRFTIGGVKPKSKESHNGNAEGDAGPDIEFNSGPFSDSVRRESAPGPSHQHHAWDVETSEDGQEVRPRVPR